MKNVFSQLLKKYGFINLDKAIKEGDPRVAEILMELIPNVGIKVGGHFRAWLFGPDGNLKAYSPWGHNLVANVGLQHILDILFVSATAQIDPWYVGITNATPSPAAGDTSASHAGWTENTAYTEGVRQTFTDSRTGQQVDNSASKATFSINTNGQSLGGAFLISDNTKGGSTGTLLCCAAFSAGNKAADNGDTLQVEYQFSAADDGA